MPIIYQKNWIKSTTSALWKIEETEDWFLDSLGLESEEEQQLALLRGHRRLEWLAARQLVHDLTGVPERHALLKDVYGKPFLRQLDVHLSISHSRTYAAAVLSAAVCGIDIQLIIPKIEMLAPKFMLPAEIAALDPATKIEQLHVCWSAKEALYKAYGKREIDWIVHLNLDQFHFDPQGGTFTGWVRKGDEEQTFDLFYEQMCDFMLCIALERAPG